MTAPIVVPVPDDEITVDRDRFNGLIRLIVRDPVCRSRFRVFWLHDTHARRLGVQLTALTGETP